VTTISIDRRQRVDAQRPVDVERARIDPGEELHDEAASPAEADAHEDEDRERRGDQQRRTGHDLRRPVADHAAEQARDRGREQRQEDDELDGKIHGRPP
jgi:hypothetical protein